MNANDLAKIVRRGDDKLRVDELVLDIGSRKLTGKGSLIITRKKLRIIIALDKDVSPPERGGAGVSTRSDFWILTGIIEDQLKFHCNFGPGHSYCYTNGKHSLGANVNHITLDNDLAPEEKRETWRIKQIMLGQPNTDEAFEAEEIERAADTSFEFQTNFAKYEIHSPNEGTKYIRKNKFIDELEKSKSDVLMGETKIYEFAFTQKRKKDLHLVMRSKDNSPAMSEAEQRQHYEALLQALAFTHGINTWPYRCKYQRGSQDAQNTFWTARSSPRSHHTPFSGLDHNVKLGKFIPAIAERLSERTTFNDELTALLFLFRQAGAKGVHHKAECLVLCALVESLIKLLFVELGCEVIPTNVNMDDFAHRKADLLTYLTALPNQNQSVQRLKDVVSSAKATKVTKIQGRFRKVCECLELKWEGKMDQVLEAWEQLRNAFAHGDFRESENISEQVHKADMVAGSRVAGGFNTIMLKFFGYSGIYKPSAFEPGHDFM